MVGYLVKVEGASIFAVRGSDHEEFSSSIFLVLGLRAGNAIAAFIAQLSFADADGGNLICGNTKVFEVTRCRGSAALTQALVVAVGSACIAMRTKLDFDTGTVAEVMFSAK